MDSSINNNTLKTNPGFEINNSSCCRNNVDKNRNPNAGEKDNVSTKISDRIVNCASEESEKTIVKPILSNSLKKDNVNISGDKSSVDNTSRIIDNGSADNVDSTNVVNVHIAPGASFSVQLQEKMQIIHGPATVRVISHHTPPSLISMPLPPGNIVHPVLDGNGVLTDLYLTPQGSISPHCASFPENMNNFSSKYSPPYPMCHQTTAHHYPIPESPNFFNEVMTSYNIDSQSKKKNTSNNSKQKIEVENIENTNKNILLSSMEVHENNRDNINRFEMEIIERLSSNMMHPNVIDLTSNSAVVHINFSNINLNSDFSNRDILYRLFVSNNKDEASNYVESYRGSLNKISLTSLKPSSKYYIKYSVIINNTESRLSLSSSFTTLATVPDIPNPPKLLSKTKSTIHLKWNAVHDNGLKIIYYILHCDKGLGFFEEVYKGLLKSYKITKLNPGTLYSFKLAAANDLGESAYSSIISFSTSGMVPLPPDPPILISAKSESLSLSWNHRTTGDLYTLQMNDQSTGHGFLPIYNGKNHSFTATCLKPNKTYKFRLQASNDEGSSSWSDSIGFETLPDKPDPPSRLQIKGKVTSYKSKVAWEEPVVTGGLQITGYKVHLKNNVEEIIDDTNICEYQFTTLQPGCSYKVYVQSVTTGVLSECSEAITLTTPPVTPGPCQAPRLMDAKSKSTHVTICWDEPENTGGASITEYNVQVALYEDQISKVEIVKERKVEPDVGEKMGAGNFREAYKGVDRQCTIAGLFPGRSYVVQVRAANKIGLGRWSESLMVTTGASAPDAPEILSVEAKSSSSILLSWSASFGNGEPVLEYKLEMASENDKEEDKISENNFQLIYVGNALSYEVTKLMAVSFYTFRVQALNIIGQSAYSALKSCPTLAGVPGSMSCFNARPKSPYEVILTWNPPVHNGSPLKQYLIEVLDLKSVTLESNVSEYVLANLQPNTLYKIRMQAMNSIGVGAFTGYAKVTTPPTPPCPPSIQCSQVGAKFLKLRWGNPTNSANIKFNLQMIGPKNKSQLIYAGPLQTFKISKLDEATEYSFRIFSSNESGDGPLSPTYTFQTCIATPPPMKAPRISELTSKTCSLEWSSLKMSSTSISVNNDHIFYELYLANDDDNLAENFVQIYRGMETSYELVNLLPSHNYRVKIRAIRTIVDSNICKQGEANELSKPDKLSNEYMDECIELNKIQNDQLIEESDISKSTTSEEYNPLSSHEKVGSELIGQFSGLVCFTTASIEKAAVISKTADVQKPKRQSWVMTEQRWAALFMFLFLLVAILFAIIASQLFQN